MARISSVSISLGFFALQIAGSLLQDLRRFFTVNTRQHFKANGKIQEPGNEFIRHCNVPGSLVSYMNVMTLVMQPLKSSAHRNNIIIGMRGEDERTLWG